MVPAFPVVAIGASAGGLQAFRKLLDHLPADLRMAYVLIPHLDPTHESLMSELLSRTAKISIREVQPGMCVEPGHAYVIAPNTIMTIAEQKLNLVPRQALRGAKQDCINHFMVSLAQAYRERAIGVILSGTASDGSQGIEAIKSEGGITFAQDDSAEFKEMPRNAVATGAVDFVLPPEAIAQELERMSRHPYLAPPPQKKSPWRNPRQRRPMGISRRPSSSSRARPGWISSITSGAPSRGASLAAWRSRRSRNWRTTSGTSKTTPRKCGPSTTNS